MDVEAVNTILYCTRWRDCVEFYRDGLGLTAGFNNDWFVEFTVNNGARISIADAARASIDSADGRGMTLTFKVADLEGALADLKGRGLSPGPIQQHAWGAKVFYQFDPDGNRIEFWSETGAG